MSMSRRSLIKAMVVVSGAALTPFARAAMSRGLTVNDAIRHLCDDAFVSPAHRASRMSSCDGQRITRSHGG